MLSLLLVLLLLLLLMLLFQEWDIDALEDSTRYDGFSPGQPVIV